MISKTNIYFLLTLQTLILSLSTLYYDMSMEQTILNLFLSYSIGQLFFRRQFIALIFVMCVTVNWFKARDEAIHAWDVMYIKESLQCAEFKQYTSLDWALWRIKSLFVYTLDMDHVCASNSYRHKQSLYISLSSSISKTFAELIGTFIETLASIFLNIYSMICQTVPWINAPFAMLTILTSLYYSVTFIIQIVMGIYENQCFVESAKCKEELITCTARCPETPGGLVQGHTS